MKSEIPIKAKKFLLYGFLAFCFLMKSCAAPEEVTGGTVTVEVEKELLSLESLNYAYTNYETNAGLVIPTNQATLLPSGATALFTAPDLPDGIELDPLTGVIYGNAREQVSNTFYIFAYGRDGYTGVVSNEVFFNFDAITLTNLTYNTNEINIPFGSDIGTLLPDLMPAGGKANYFIFGGDLPDGIVLDRTTGTISGKAETTLTNRLTIIADGRDGFTQSVSTNILIGVSKVELTNLNYSITNIRGTFDLPIDSSTPILLPSFTNLPPGKATARYVITNGDLPAGIELDDATGEITGTPTSIIVTNATIVATGDKGYFGSAIREIVFNIAPRPLESVVYNSTTFSGPVGEGITPLTATITPTGATVNNQIVEGRLPSGIILNQSGLIFGTPNEVITTNVVIETRGIGGYAGVVSNNISFNVSSVALSSVSYPSPINGIVGQALTPVMRQITPTGATARYVVTNGTLPGGILLNSISGEITGTPTNVNTNTITIAVTGTTNYTGTLTTDVTFNFSEALTRLNYSNDQLTTFVGTEIAPILPTLTPSAGEADYQVASSTSIPLPTGLVLNTNTGVITGTPSQNANGVLTIEAVGKNGYTGTQSANITLDIATQISNLTYTTNNVVAEIGSMIVANSPSFGSLTGVNADYSEGSPLPAGLNLNPQTGIISGTPTAVGVSTNTIRATGRDGYRGTSDYEIVFNILKASLVELDYTSTNITGGLGVAINNSNPILTPGGATVTYRSTNGGFPSGIGLDPNTGVIFGTPNEMITTNVTIVATGNGDYTDSVSRDISITIRAGAVTNLAYSSSTINGRAGQSIAPTVPQVLPSGATVAYELTSGTLPNGIDLDNSNGRITGTPSSLSTNTVTITVRGIGNYGGSATNNITFNITEELTGLNYSTNRLEVLNGVPLNNSLVATLTPSAGEADYQVASTSTIPLPIGLNLDPNTGAITGTPSQNVINGVLTIEAMGKNGYTGTESFNITLNITTQISNLTYTTNNVVGGANSMIMTNSPAFGSLTGVNASFSVVSGPLPTGLNLNPATGIISGIPANAGTSIATIRATGNNGYSGTSDYEITFDIEPGGLEELVYSETNISKPLGVAIPRTVATLIPTGSSASFEIVNGTLPPGLSFNTNDGEISGVASAFNTGTITVEAAGIGSTVGTARRDISFNISKIGITNFAIASNSSTFEVTVGSNFTEPTLLINGQILNTFANDQFSFSLSLISGSDLGGISINTNTGVLDFTPDKVGVGNYRITITGRESGDHEGTATADFTIAAGVVVSVLDPNAGGGIRAFGVTMPLPAMSTVNPDDILVGGGGTRRINQIFNGTTTVTEPQINLINDGAANALSFTNGMRTHFFANNDPSGNIAIGRNNESGLNLTSTGVSRRGMFTLILDGAKFTPALYRITSKYRIGFAPSINWTGPTFFSGNFIAGNADAALTSGVIASFSTKSNSFLPIDHRFTMTSNDLGIGFAMGIRANSNGSGTTVSIGAIRIFPIP